MYSSAHMAGRPQHYPDAAPADLPTADRWEAFLHWAQRFYASRGFGETELGTTLHVSERLRRARGALLAGSKTWPTLLERAFGAPNDLTARPAQGRFLTWCAHHPVPAQEALQALWRDAPRDAPSPATEGPGERIRDFLARAAPGVPGRPRGRVAGDGESSRSAGGRLNLASFLLMAIDPTRFPVYEAQHFRSGYALTGASPPPPDADEGAIYDHALALLDRLIAGAQRTGLALSHRLHAATALRCVTRGEPPAEWTALERAAFRRYHAQEGRGAGRPVRPAAGRRRPAPEGAAMPFGPPPAPFGATAAEAPPRPSLASLADALLFPEHDLIKIERLLADKGQCLFYGPPGTGKTYVARALATHFAGGSAEPEGGAGLEGGGARPARGEARVDVVQFHPSYAYEDFVEGYRPRLIRGRPGFELVDGPLKRLARRAEQAPQQRHVLVIDELNRGNVAKIFGELYYLLEYRGQSITLQYSGEPFRLPPNLWIVGTMNTADRSIAIVDLALRRRFYFVPFFPDEPPVEGLLRRWLERHHPRLMWVADAVDRANRRLEDRHTAIGPSYFLRPDLTAEWVDLIWEHAVLPYIAEQFPDDPAALQDFALARLRPPDRPLLVAEGRGRYGRRPPPTGETARGARGAQGQPPARPRET